MRGLIVDLFAGGGGASTGIESALGRSVDLAINHSAVALAVHAANHPTTRHLTADIWEVDPRIACGRRPIDLLWASPDCRHFSRAKSGVPRSKSVRSLAHVVVEWARAKMPRIILLENVPEFVTWGPLDAEGLPDKARAGESFALWRAQLELLGYAFDMRVLDSSHFGAPTKRRRLFMVARCDGEPIRWPDPTHGPGLAPYRTAAECIDWSLPCRSIFGRSKPLAEKTLARIAEGIRRFVLESPDPFVVDGSAPLLVQTGYGEREGQRPRALDIHAPMGTLVAGGCKQALVSAFISRFYGGARPPIGKSLTAPLPTVTAWDHNSIAAVALAKFRGTSPGQPMSCDPRAPLPTISAGGIHVAAVVALLERHGVGSPVVTVRGEPYVITDIGMRMLEPHELLRAQFGKFADDYDMNAASTKAAKIRLVGNSVCPEVAEALVRANAVEVSVGRVA
jgi:DNA (cytosine-5)-methyltransferase 1